MLRWYCSREAIHKSRYATPVSVMEYILRAGPPFSLVCQVLSMSPFFSICLSVRYNVPGLIASSQKQEEELIVEGEPTPTATPTVHQPEREPPAITHVQRETAAALSILDKPDSSTDHEQL
jgi:hypothetical protein